MQVLVTGGAGYIGSHVVDLLVREGHDLTVLDSLDGESEGLESGGIDYLTKPSFEGGIGAVFYIERHVVAYPRIENADQEWPR